MKPYWRPTLKDVLFGDHALLDHTAYAQAALFALQVSLARLWQRWGFEPDVVLGHSLGQYAAACVAGVFTCEQGLRLLVERGRLMGALPSGGAMAAVFAPAPGSRQSSKLIPASRSPPTTGHRVVSGPAAAVATLINALENAGVRCQALATSHAFHSPLVEPALDDFEAFAAELEPRPAQRTLVCNLTGRPLAHGQLLDAAYWRRHAREPVSLHAVSRRSRTWAARSSWRSAHSRCSAPWHWHAGLTQPLLPPSRQAFAAV